MSKLRKLAGNNEKFFIALDKIPYEKLLEEI